MSEEPTTDDKPRGIKLALMPEVRTDGAARAEGELALTMPNRDRGRQSQGKKATKWINPKPIT